MTIIVFLIDTSASMNQRTFIGLGARPTLLDIAKGAVESFVKHRQRNPESRFDRFMLFTSEETPNNIKAGWKENLATFMNELKNISASGLSTLGPATKNIFDVLNINRMQSGIDTYGSGRNPFFLEPSVIICITDGGKLSSPQGVQDDLFPLPKLTSIPGAELTSEMFRWDQRLFGLVLRLTGTPTPETSGLVPSDNSPLDRLCEQTGGRSYAVRSYAMFQQCIESLVAKVQSGVIINFEKIGPDPPPTPDTKETAEICDADKENQIFPPIETPSVANGSPGILGASPTSGWSGSQPTPPSAPSAPALIIPAGTSWHNCRKMIYVPRPMHRTAHGCFWPIPESYWPDSNLPSLPSRSAHPNLKFTCTSQEPMVIDNLPFDKYELEPSPLTQYILSRKQPTVCWQVFIANSSKHSDVGHPFGYLKASTTKPCVNLFVMPYNYPVLLPLLDDLFKTHRLKPAKEWRQQFENYLRTMPPYYVTPLKRALERMGVLNLFPDKFDASLSYIVVNQLKKLKNQAKVEYDRICAEVEKRISLSSNGTAGGLAPGSSSSSGGAEGIRVKSRRYLSRHLTSNHLLKEKLSPLRDKVPEFKGFTMWARDAAAPQPQLYRNPFDIDRAQLIDQLARMRANFLQQSVTSLLTDRGHDQLHCKPIGQMGNYQDYLKKMNAPLREIEVTPVRQHMFGNPFKIDKMSMMVDEADVDLMGSGSPRGAGGTKRPAPEPQLASLLRPNKRRKGPIPRDVPLYRFMLRLSSPANSPPASPDPHDEMLPPISPPVMASSFQAPIPTPTPPEPLVPPVPATPNYLRQASPPGSPAASPYPREDSFQPPSLHPIINGDIDLNPVDVESRSSGGESDSEGELEIHEPPPSPPYVPNGPAQPPEAIVPPPLPDDTAQTQQTNRALLLLCYKEVKRPGREFSSLLSRLAGLQGSSESRVRALEEVIHEASRFKRHALVALLTQRLEAFSHLAALSQPLSSAGKPIVLNGHNS